MNGQSDRVQPGDLITSELMNRIVSRLEALEQANLKLGSLGADTHTLVALGAGFESTAGIWLDGVSLLSAPATRGVNLVILSPALAVKFQRSYDTFGTAPANDLASDLIARTTQYDIVVAVTRDAYLAGLTASAKSALAAVGAAALGDPGGDTRANAAFIGIVPANKATVRYNYLVSVMPPDSAGFTSALLAAQPFAWGVYSVPLRRFLLGGAAGSPVSAPPQQPGGGVKELEKVPDNFKAIQDTKAIVIEGKLSDVFKDSEAKLTDAKVTDVKLTDAVKITDAKATEVKLTDAKATDVKLTDAVKTTDAKATDVKLTDAVKTTDAKATDVKLTDAVKATDAKLTDGVLIPAGGISPDVRGVEPPPAVQPAAGGQAFISPQERPQVDASVVQGTEPKKNARRGRKPA